MTYENLAEAISIDYHSGQPNESTSVTPRQIVIMINKAFATLAKKNAYENASVEGLLYSNDEYICTFSVPLNQADSSGYRYFDMPTAPVGLPKSRGIVFVGPTMGATNGFKKIPANNLSVYLTCNIPNTVAYWIQGNKGYVKSLGGNLLPNTITVKTIGTSVSNLDDEINAPMDAIMEAHMIVLNWLKQQKGKDTTNDNLDIPDVQ